MNYFAISEKEKPILLSKLGFYGVCSKKRDCTILCLFSTGGIAPIRFQPEAVRLYRPANPLAAKRLESNNHPERKISFKCKQGKELSYRKIVIQR